ncbi:ATP-binding response regulator [Tahibacter amnicola]|uniref:Oxygen sensor histidine kinase NreB n=1 Tax=Tahibacter amnicola TaxID=2976241 RepID=A0ABY6BB70_9GAMM|nr:response regulator [Tahibacter amnicola]UXI67052.1 response regulator [Tahibacter amnicola]
MEVSNTPSGGRTARPLILVVDDSPSTIDTLTAFLGTDYRIVAVTDGASALASVAAQPPDLVLLDVVMPGLDGIEVCHRLKADATTRAIPVIFITARDDEESELAAFEAGAVDVIRKPFSHLVVRRRVRTQVALKLFRDHLVRVPVRLGMELHDHQAQLMTGLLFQLDAACHVLGPASDATPVRRYIDRAAELARQCMAQTRQTIRELRETAADDEALAEGIARTLRPFADNTETVLRIRQRGLSVPLDGDARHALCRVAQEAATNAVRHGRATEIDVLVAFDEPGLRLVVRDDGCGFDTARVAGGSGMGLSGMRERMTAVGGRLQIQSQPGRGTCITAEVPL